MEKRELIKINCQAVVLVKDGDKVLREETTQMMSCYSVEELADFFAKTKAEVDQINEAQKPSRKTRRAT